MHWLYFLSAYAWTENETLYCIMHYLNIALPCLAGCMLLSLYEGDTVWLVIWLACFTASTHVPIHSYTRRSVFTAIIIWQESFAFNWASLIRLTFLDAHSRSSVVQQANWIFRLSGRSSHHPAASYNATATTSALSNAGGCLNFQTYLPNLPNCIIFSKSGASFVVWHEFHVTWGKISDFFSLRSPSSK